MYVCMYVTHTHKHTQFHFKLASLIFYMYSSESLKATSSIQSNDLDQLESLDFD